MVENIVSLFEEIEIQDEMFNAMYGGQLQAAELEPSYSARKGNKGRFCTLTLECQSICSWF